MNNTVQKQPIPWQQRQEIGYFKALWNTIKQVLFRPVEFFNNLEISDSYLAPFSFQFIIFIVTSAVSSLIGSLLLYIILSTGQSLPMSTALIAFLLSLIIGGAVGVFVISAIIHLFALLFRGKGRFIATFNVIAYSAAAGIFIIIPIIGPIIASLWMLLIIVRGLKRIHNFNIAKAITVCLCSFILLSGVTTALRKPHMTELKRESQRLAEEVELKRKEIQQSINERERLKNDPQYLEERAREKLGLE